MGVSAGDLVGVALSGSAACGPVTFVSPSELTCNLFVTPTVSYVANVSVTTTSGGIGTGADLLQVVGPTLVTAITPSSATIQGGTAVTIELSNAGYSAAADVASVTVGGVACGPPINATGSPIATLSCVTGPGGAGGPADVVVNTRFGNDTLAGAFNLTTCGDIVEGGCDACVASGCAWCVADGVCNAVGACASAVDTCAVVDGVAPALAELSSNIDVTVTGSGFTSLPSPNIRCKWDATTSPVIVVDDTTVVCATPPLASAAIASFSLTGFFVPLDWRAPTFDFEFYDCGTVAATCDTCAAAGLGNYSACGWCPGGGVCSASAGCGEATVSVCPTITGVEPASGVPANVAGYDLTVTGVGFFEPAGTLRCVFGGAADTRATVIDAETITCPSVAVTGGPSVELTLEDLGEDYAVGSMVPFALRRAW